MVPDAEERVWGRGEVCKKPTPVANRIAASFTKFARRCSHVFISSVGSLAVRMR